MTEISLVRADQSDLDAGSRTDLARLIYLSLPDFYNALPGTEDDRLGIISAETATPGTECENPWLARDGCEIVGAICAFPLSELQNRQQQSVLGLMRRIDRSARTEFRNAVRDSGHSVQPFEDVSGLYIARITVAPSRQGTGLGQKLIEALVARVGDCAISLHVDRDNRPAIKFYEKLSFRFLPATDSFRKRAMRRP